MFNHEDTSIASSSSLKFFNLF
uniref:Uncharacterized protein n=1 Tax=Arundo donax TaxID=35708 RepID=A0A0A8Z6X7_ARUDO